jgi:hypothetical protein
VVPRRKTGLTGLGGGPAHRLGRHRSKRLPPARSLVWAASLLALSACREEPSPPVADAPPTLAKPAPQPAAGPPEHLEPQLCAALAGVVATESEGFARLRSRPLAADSWLGRVILPGSERCIIEGEAWPRARYLCVGPPIRADGRDGAALAFEALARELEQCLERPSWFPRAWEAGERFEFAMGERLQAWTDRTTWPPSQVVLKVQQDAAGGAYRVKLNLEAVP